MHRMFINCKPIFGSLTLICLFLLTPVFVKSQLYLVHPVKQGFSIKLSMNEIGWLGIDSYVNAYTPFPYFSPGTMGCEYPSESMMEHLFNGGILIGAIQDVGTPGRARLAKKVISTQIQLL